jgi:hypothetical protein
MARDGCPNVGQQLLVIPWLLDEVLGARADRIDDVAHGAEGSDHDDGKLRVLRRYPRQQIDAAFTRQRQVEQEQVEVRARKRIETAWTIDGKRDIETFKRQQDFQRLANAGFVIDDEQASHTGRGR